MPFIAFRPLIICITLKLKKKMIVLLFLEARQADRRGWGLGVGTEGWNGRVG